MTEPVAVNDPAPRQLKAMIAGLTGSGKTTTAKLVAHQADVEYVSGSALRARYLGVVPIEDDRDRRAFWQASLAARAADAARLSDFNAESELDQQMLARYRASNSGVFDVWFMPWLAGKTDGLRVWLDVDAQLRRQRLAAAAPGMSPDHVWEQAVQKDERSRSYGQRHYGFDLAHDWQPFDAILRPAANSEQEDIAAAVVWCWQHWCGEDAIAPTAVRALVVRVPVHAAGAR